MIGTILLSILMVLVFMIGGFVAIMSGSTLAIMAFYTIFCILVFAMIMVGSAKRKKKMRKYEQVSLGMSEAEMLKIMGKKYNKSSLKNNRFKYEWRYSNGVSASYHGVRAYSGVSKVDIYINNGVVEEIRPYNC